MEGKMMGSNRNVYEILDDKFAMKEVSKTIAEKAENEKEDSKTSMLRTAYNLWINADGTLDDPHIKKLRQEIHSHEKESDYQYETVYSWLNKKDVFGKIEAYYDVINKNPKVAYHLAKSFNNEALVQHAIQQIINKSPEESLNYFTQLYDLKAIRLSLESIAGKYSLSIDRVKELLNC